MNRLAAGLLLLSGFSGMAAYGADSQLVNMVMPDVKVLAGINVKTAELSPLGQYLVAQISSTQDANLQKLIGATGFDPRTDLTEILAASGADTANPGGLLLARGAFNVAAISAAALKAPNASVETYAGATLISSPGKDAEPSHGVAFIGNTIAVAGNLTLVKAAVDRSTAANTMDATLAASVKQLSAANDEWIVSTISPGGFLPNKASANGTPAVPLPVLNGVKSIQSFEGGIKFGVNDQASLHAVATDAQSAQAIASVVKLGLAMASMNASKDPSGGQLVQILQNLQATSNGTSVDLSISVPEAQLEALIGSVHVKAQHAARPQQ